jgi:dTMP kinase
MAFLVIEGLDGSGKSTQLNMLQEFLKSQHIPYRFLHFPRIDAPVYGDLVARFLRGELGDINNVNPWLVALIYAGDRNDAATMIKAWSDAGEFVIVDRYVDSNIAFQCAKVSEPLKKKELKEWIEHLEYQYNKIPKPDLSLFLDVPFAFTRDRLSNQRDGEDRNYLQGKADIHEADLDFQSRVRQVYLNLADERKDFIRLDCSADSSSIKKPDAIFEMIRESIISHGLIKI